MFGSKCSPSRRPLSFSRLSSPPSPVPAFTLSAEFRATAVRAGGRWPERVVLCSCCMCIGVSDFSMVGRSRYMLADAACRCSCLAPASLRGRSSRSYPGGRSPRAYLHQRQSSRSAAARRSPSLPSACSPSLPPASFVIFAFRSSDPTTSFPSTSLLLTGTPCFDTAALSATTSSAPCFASAWPGVTSSERPTPLWPPSVPILAGRRRCAGRFLSVRRPRVGVVVCI